MGGASNRTRGDGRSLRKSKMTETHTNFDISLPGQNLLWYDETRERQETLPEQRQTR